MTCPNCQNICGETDAFCFRCGTPLSAPAPKKGTHIIPLLLLLGLSVLGIALFFLIPMDSPAAQPDTPWFLVEEGVLYFDESQYAGSSEIVIPETVNGQQVVAIGQAAFAGCTRLTTVVLPNSVQTVGAQAFAGCASLRGIHLPEGVTTIGSQAFSGCSALEAISIPSTAESIESTAFEGCGKLFHIFYNGEFSQWQTLYSAHINLETQVYCSDGAHLQR